MAKNKINKIKAPDNLQEKDKVKNNFFTFYDRRDVANSKLANRDADFYIKASSKNINRSLIIMMVALTFSLMKIYTVSKYPGKSTYYIAGVDGRIYDLKWTPEKKQQTFNAIVEIREEQARNRQR